jgi:hypothetical protein
LRCARPRSYFGSRDGDRDAGDRALSCALPVLQLAGAEGLMTKFARACDFIGLLATAAILVFIGACFLVGFVHLVGLFING